MEIIVIMLALSAAFFFGLSHVLTKKGLDHVDVLESLFISLLVNVIFLWILAFFFVPLELYLSSAILTFVIAGFLAPGFARLFNITAIKHLGVSRAAPIVGISTLFTVLISILFLNEPFRIEVIIATICVFGGIVLISTSQGAKGPLEKKYILVALVAAAAYGVAAPIQKAGLNMLSYPILAATITTTTSLILLTIYLTATKKLHATKISKGSMYAGLGGIATGLAFLLNFTAMSKGDLSLVAPVTATFPLFGLALSQIFIKEHEKITIGVVAGAVITVLGIIIITVF